jgi:DNA polymerase III alpha subunit
LELDHKSGDRTDSSFENLERLCASCHKKKEYACGRTKRGEKGYPSIAVSIVSIEPLEEVETYDVTMEGPNHNFVVSSGIVTCNSHAACYGVVGYRTAYLKAHAPIAFFTAWLLNARHKQDPLQEVYELVNDAKLFDIDVQPPDLRSLEPHFHTDRRVIKFGLTDVKGIGPSQMKMLPDAVKEVETFLQKKIGDWNWWEFLVHFSNKVSAATITKFAKVGALRWLSKSRRLTEEEFKVWSQLTANEQKWVQEHSQEFSELTPALRALAKPKKEGGGAANKNRISIIQSHAILLENPATPTIDTPLSMAYDEEDLLGIAITCSQVDACDLSQVNCSCKEFFAGRTGFMLLGVQVEQSKELKTKTGKSPGSKYLRLMIGDGTCSLEAVAWSEVNKEYGRLLTEGNSVIVQVERDYKDKESKCATIKKVWQAVQTV